MIGPVKFADRENVAENLFGQDVLNQHFPRLPGRHPPADGVLTLGEKRGEPLLKRRLMGQRPGQQVIQCRNDRRQFGAEPGDSLVEMRHFRRAKGEKTVEQAIQRRAIAGRRAQYLLTVLNQHRRAGVLEQDIGSGIALGELGGDFLVQSVAGILGFPPAMHQPHPIQQRAIRSQGFARRCRERMLLRQDELMLDRTGFEQASKSLRQRAFVLGARHPPQGVQLAPIRFNVVHGRHQSLPLTPVPPETPAPPPALFCPPPASPAGRNPAPPRRSPANPLPAPPADFRPQA